MSYSDLSACGIYATGPLGPSEWMGQSFPSGNPAFLRMSARELTQSREAWNFFELVESTDAATRERVFAAGVPPNYSDAPVVTPSLWYPLTGLGDRTLYTKGRWLHIRVCPALNWTSQRNRPFMYPPLPLVVGPEPCYIDGTEAMCACQLVDAGRCVAVADITEKHDTITHVEEPVVQPPQQHPELVIEETPPVQPQQQHPELVIEETQPQQQQNPELVIEEKQPIVTA